jgi:HSP20 family protein
MLTRWDSASALDRLFDDVMGSAFGTATSVRAFEPAIDVRTSEDEVRFVCDVPGLKQEDLEITLEDHLLTIKGTRRYEAREHEQVMLGRAYGAFRRSFTLPDSLDGESLSASLDDGVLTVRIPKHARAKPRKIEIGNGHGVKKLGA